MCKLSSLIVFIVFVLTGHAQSPHGKEFKLDCAACHTSQTWKVAKANMTFDHNTTHFKLTGQHVNTDCINCHKTLVFIEAKTECSACHIDMHQNTLGPDCFRCHDTKEWIIKNIIPMHQMSRFPLLGNHAVLDCSACHKSASSLKYEPLGVECIDCHRKDYQATVAPNHQQNGYPTNCIECHDVIANNWTKTNFNHGLFPLTGGHNITCAECHKSGSYQKISSECVSCHQVQYNNAKGHVASKFSTDCRTCHNSTNWLGANFNHSTTIFPLTGAHATVDCALCHATGYVGTPADCNSCHQTNYTSAQAPSHTKAGISVDCKTCHTTAVWQPSTFNHSITVFPLTGAHATIVQCSDCHLGNTTSAKPDCISCHQVQFNSAKGHVASKFPTDCKICHNMNNWLGSSFNHNTTIFPLTGAHATVDCTLCHTTGYVGTPTDCNSCHQANYTSTQAPSHTKAGISVDCKTCHTTTVWQPSTFNHSTTVFPLTGAHTAIAQCSDCHLGNTTSAKPDCISCHQVQYNGAKGHVASKFPTDCKICHNMNNWLGATFNHSNTIFPLTGAHTNVDCALCHTTGYVGTPTDCNSCHQANYTSAQAPSHTKAGISVDCKTCHTTTVWQPSTFSHSTTVFPLVGAHATIVQCSDCHLGNTTSAKPDCISCHQVQYNGAKDHVASKFPTDCRICHNMNNWLGATFNHSNTIFPLTGAHTNVDCALCHVTGYAGTPTDCNSCHQANYTSAQAPSHSKAGISVDCKTCHTTTVWQPSTFSHSTTVFPLVGTHATIVQCSDCHLGNTTSAKPDCISCHQVQYTGAKGHVASKFPTDCRICHNMNNWLGAIFDHNTTVFPLTGAHTTVDCALCHTNGYVGTPTDCNSCHQANYTSAQAPSHSKAGISVDCKTCHTTTVWQPSTFNHSTTVFPLVGTHATIAQCSDCHLGNTTSAKPDCISCHQVQYNGAKGHVASKFPTDCKICHNMNNWLGAIFDHNTTVFPLTGAHTTVDCTLCHATGYAGTPTDCNSCHQANYTSAQAPSHSKAGISVDCKTCHTTTVWQPSTFNHSTTVFPLVGAHTTIAQCSDCHLGNTTSAKPDCISCHQVQYNGAKDHVASKFPTDCRICHNMNNWLGVTFNHSTTNFPLTGAHLTVDCASCHSTGYVGTSMVCNSCHQANYNSTTNPNHKTLALSVTCTDCHTTVAGWQPATFPIHSTYYALTGYHLSVDCASCHKGVYPNTPKTCYGCHASNYTSTKNPPHLSAPATFTTDCASCHSTTLWAPAPGFNHTSYFPISSGRHNLSCATCHTTPTNYAVFSCVTAACHGNAHNQNQGSAGCYRCHPTGRSD